MSEEKNKTKTLALIFVVLSVLLFGFAMTIDWEQEEIDPSDLIPDEFRPIEDAYDELEGDLRNLWIGIVDIRSQYMELEGEIGQAEYDDLGDKLSEIKNDFYGLEEKILDGDVNEREGRDKIRVLEDKISTFRNRISS